MNPTVAQPQGVDLGDQLTRDQALAVTTKIKSTADALWDLIVAAYKGRAWSALGYESWDLYCLKEFGAARLRLPREERPEMVRSLRQSGLSLRAIESATGVSRPTIIKDLQVESPPHRSPKVEQRGDWWASVLASQVATDVQVVNSLPPVDEDALAEELIAAQSAPVLGLDGKTYHPQPVHRPLRERPRRPITNAFTDAAMAVEKAAERIERLVADDRFARNRETLRSNKSWLVDARDKLTAAIDQLSGSDDGA